MTKESGSTREKERETERDRARERQSESHRERERDRARETERERGKNIKIIKVSFFGIMEGKSIKQYRWTNGLMDGRN